MPDNQHEKTAKISRKAWPVVVARLARFEIVEIRIAPPPKSATKSMEASSSSASSVAEPPLSETGRDRDLDAKGLRTNLDPHRPQMPSSLSEPQSHTRRRRGCGIVVDFTGMIMHLASFFRRIACTVISHLVPLHLSFTTLM